MTGGPRPPGRAPPLRRVARDITARGRTFRTDGGAPVAACSPAPDPQPRGQIVVVLRTPRYLRNRKHLTAFHDCSGVVDYDVQARAPLMRWSRANVASFDAVHLPLESRIIDLLLKVIGAIVPGTLISHPTRFSFDAANARHIDR